MGDFANEFSTPNIIKRGLSQDTPRRSSRGIDVGFVADGKIPRRPSDTQSSAAIQSPKTALLLASGITAGVDGLPGFELRAIFDDLDADKNGFIDQDEAVAGLNKFSASLAEETSVLAAEMFINADLDGDGKISFEEFTKFLEETQHLRVHQYEVDGGVAKDGKILDHTQQSIPIVNGRTKPIDKHHIMASNDTAGTGEWAQEERAVAAAIEHQEGSAVGLTTLKGRLEALMSGGGEGGGILMEAAFVGLLEELRLFEDQHDLRARIFGRFDTDG
jgi:hypothetical protein